MSDGSPYRSHAASLDSIHGKTPDKSPEATLGCPGTLPEDGSIFRQVSSRDVNRGHGSHPGHIHVSSRGAGRLKTPADRPGSVPTCAARGTPGRSYCGGVDGS